VRLRRASIGGEKELRRHIKRMQVMGSILLSWNNYDDVLGLVWCCKMMLGFGFGLECFLLNAQLIRKLENFGKWKGLFIVTGFIIVVMVG